MQTGFLKTSFQNGMLSKVWITDKPESNFGFYTNSGELIEVRLTNADYLIETVGNDCFPLVLFGAGHVGRATVKALADLPFSITWVDSRKTEFPEVMPANVQKLRTDEPLGVIDKALPQTLFVIFTHNHQLDYELTKAILRRKDAQFCGLIGSATKRARFENKLLKERVLDEAELGSLTCPIGIGGIYGKEPEVIAASLTAQLLQVVTSPI